ncbi:MAG TPA: hypothetical protein V6C97_22715 [Oculatellaceae cyanobacterium]
MSIPREIEQTPEHVVERKSEDIRQTEPHHGLIRICAKSSTNGEREEVDRHSYRQMDGNASREHEDEKPREKEQLGGGNKGRRLKYPTE